MIDEQRTLELFGYVSNELKPRSRKKIIRVCNKCSKEDIMGFGDYNRGNKYLCQSCSRKQILKPPTPKFVPESERFLNDTRIDRIKTIKQFGYDPIDLKNKSQRRVIVICKNCGKIRENIFNNYRDLCKSCSISKSRKGKKFSDEHKANMRKNHAHLSGKDAPGWKGGFDWNRPWVLPETRCIKINTKFNGSEFHHLSKSIGIYIPKELHNHLYHSLKNNINMDEMSVLAFQFIKGEI